MKLLLLSLLLLSLAAPSCRSSALNPTRPTQPTGAHPASGDGEDSRSYYKQLNDSTRSRDPFTDTDLIYY